MKEKLYNALEDYMIRHEWDYIAEQARAMFTTICIMNGIESDEEECDGMLRKLYDKSAMEFVMGYDEFVDYMVELIV